MPDVIAYEMFCPRCDRQYVSGVSLEDVTEQVENHVREQHPDHDVDWGDNNAIGEVGGFITE